MKNKRKLCNILLVTLLTAIFIFAGYMFIVSSLEDDITPVDFSQEAISDLLCNMALEAQPQSTLYFKHSMGDGIEDKIDSTIYDLHESDYMPARFVQKLNWECKNRLGYTILSVSAEYAEDVWLLDDMLEYNPKLVPVEYSKQNLKDWIIDAIRNGREYALGIFSGTLKELETKLAADIEYLHKNNSDCCYFIDRFDWQISEYTGCVEVDLSLKYLANKVPYDKIMPATSEIGVIDCMMDTWSSGKSVAVMRLLDPSWDHEKLFSLCKTAEANCAELCSEGAYFNCKLSPRYADDRIAEVWIDFPMDDDELRMYNARLSDELDDIEAMIRAKGITDDNELYRAIHDAVNAATRYDDDVAEATKKQELTPQMHAARSAYGAVVDGLTVCTGYARAFKALCDRLDLPCWVVYGEQEGEAHAWNMLLIDGKVRYVDCTFNDTGDTDEYFMFDQHKYNNEKYVADEGFVLPW
ncbi:MAG: hypothetical protein RR527_08325 [Clostridia bacterium]